MAPQKIMQPQFSDLIGKRRHCCHACSGRGMFAPSIPSCSIKMPRKSWIVVERCDSCERFEDDLAAALSRYAIAGWFLCKDGGWHAIADCSSSR